VQHQMSIIYVIISC